MAHQPPGRVRTLPVKLDMNSAAPAAFLTGAPGPLEVLLVFLAVLLLFGPKRLPEIARTLGRAIDQLRRASDEFRHNVMSMESESDWSDPVPNVDDAEPSDETGGEAGGATGEPGQKQ